MVLLVGRLDSFMTNMTKEVLYSLPMVETALLLMLVPQK